MASSIDAWHEESPREPPVGTEAVRAHVRSLITANTEHTGFIAGPTHSFTPDTPPENILAVYAALHGS